MLSSVGLATAFDWDTERITYDEIKKYADELDSVHRLRRNSIYCPNCKQRLVIDSKISEIVYCTCSNVIKSVNRSVSNVNVTNDGWKPYMERSNMVIWRREEKPGLYAYKGNFTWALLLKTGK